MPPSHARGDEVSLRDLYLVLRRSSPWILLATVVVAIAAYAFVATRPPVYVAEATTVVARAPLDVNLGTGLRFRPEATVSFDTYTTMAFSRDVLEQVLDVHEQVDVGALRPRLVLERVAGPTGQAAASYLAVTHTVRSRDPEVAAASADAWVEATVATVRALLLENMDAVELITGDVLTVMRARLEEAEAVLGRFRADAGPDGLVERIAALDLLWGDLRSDYWAREVALAARTAERDALVAGHEAPDGELGVVLAEAPEVVLGLDGAILSLAARIAALEAERERLLEVMAEADGERRRLALDLSAAQTRLAVLERGVREAKQAVDTLAAIDPSVAYVAQLASSGARVLSDARTPSAPEPHRAGLVAVLAAVITAIAGVVTALLAEAVRSPNGTAPQARARSAA